MIALFDSDIIHYAIGFTTQDVDSEGIVANRIDTYIDERLNLLHPTDYLFFHSSPVNFRKLLLSSYKENRKDFVKPRHFSFIKQYLIDNYGSIEHSPYEADDLLAIYSTEDTVICSRDKDLYQIPGHHFDLKECTFHHVDPQDAIRWFYKQVLMGDKTDNIIGIRGIGPAKADKLLPVNAFDDDLYERCLDVYLDNNRTEEEMQLNCHLLWMIRNFGEQWEPPFGIKQWVNNEHI